MRFHYHDVRDMPQAIVLACDLRRLVHASLAVLWTFSLVLALMVLLNWRATGDWIIKEEGLLAAADAVWGTPFGLGRTVFWACALTGWWLGFGYLNAPVVRSAALELGRDERGKLKPEPLLYRMSAAAPVLAMAIPGLFAACVLIWSFLAHIPGLAGGVVVAITLPIALICALVAALGLLLVCASAPMMPATACVEGRDYLEALSRPAGFVLQKPFRYAGYLAAKAGVVLTAALLGALVLGIAWAIIAGCMYLVGAGDVAGAAYSAATEPAPVMTTDQWPPFVMASVFWGSALMLVCWLSVVSQCTDLITYLLMRYRIEGTTFDQVMIAEERLKLFPTALDTAAEAEAARKRFDAQKAAKAEPAKGQ